MVARGRSCGGVVVAAVRSGRGAAWAAAGGCGGPAGGHHGRSAGKEVAVFGQGRAARAGGAG